jgi:hypothetical protein
MIEELEEKRAVRKFHQHALHGELRELKKMIWYGQVDIRAKNPNSDWIQHKEDVMFFALKGGHLEVIDYLHRIGFTVKGYRNGLIKMMAHRGHVEALEYMINNGCIKVRVLEAAIMALVPEIIHNEQTNKVEKLQKIQDYFKVDVKKVAEKYYKRQEKAVQGQQYVRQIKINLVELSGIPLKPLNVTL